MTYLIVKTLVLSISVVLIAIGAELGAHVFLWLGLATGGAMGIITVMRSAMFPARYWSLCGLHGGAVLVSYYGGALFTLVTFGTDEIIQSGYTTHADPSLIFFAAVLIALYAMVLELFGLYEHTHWRELFRTLPDVSINRAVAAMLLIAMASLQAYLLITGRVSFQGFDTTVTGGTPALEQLATRLSLPILGVCGYILGDRERRFGMTLVWLCVILIPLELVWTTSFGRRALIYSFTAMVGAFFWSRGSITLNLKAILLVAGGLAAIYVLSNLFITIRLSQDPITARMSQTMFDHLGSAADTAQSMRAKILQTHFRNLQTRFFVIGYLSDLIAGTRPGSALVGLGLVTSIALIIPSVIFPGKARFFAEFGKDESLINPSFGLPITDNAVTGLTMAYADFLWLGVVIYPVVMLVLAILISKIVLFMKDQVLRVYCMIFGLVLFMTTEETMTFYFVGLRTLVVVAVGIGLLRLIMGPEKLQSRISMRGYKSDSR